MPDCSTLLSADACTVLATVLARAVRVLMTWPSEATPLIAILLSPVAALVYFAGRRIGRWRAFRYRRVLAAVLSRRYLGHRSHVLDVALTAANIGVFGALCFQFVISMTATSALVHLGLETAFGATVPTTLPAAYVAIVWAVVLFAGYEFAYWLDHYLSHHVPLLWEFHKVHHSAEVLSPLTNFRVHPIDSIVYMNVLMLTTGVLTGVLHHVFGAGKVVLEPFGLTTMIGLVVTVIGQLQHSHIWMPFTGTLGKLLLSPAHHQIHHSVDCAHHNRNFGNVLAVFDWACGTLHMPTKQRQKLVFGLGAGQTCDHDLAHGLTRPFADAWRVMHPTASGEAATVTPAPAPGHA